MPDLLRPEELSYMRATQADARPTLAQFRAKVTTRTPTGGTTTTHAVGDPVDVRIDAARDELPQPLAARFGTATPYKIVMDLVRDVRDGDRLDVTATEAYEIVTDGDPDRWATAQVVYARRIAFPAR